MPTSNSKALRRATRGQASKLTSSVSAKKPSRNVADQTTVRSQARKKPTGSRLTPSMSASGQSSKGRSATVGARVSHATRSPKSKGKTQASSHPGVAKKRRTSKTANPKGKFSTPDLSDVSDRQIRARAAGRRNKATATVSALKRA